MSTPKSGRSRLVMLSERAATVLQRLQMVRVDRAKRHGWKTIPEYIFATNQGQTLSPVRIRSVFAQVLEAAELPAHHSPHSLRHTYATLLLRNGESLKFVYEQLGHASIKLTADLYGKWAKTEPVRGGANVLDAFTRPQLVAETGSNESQRMLEGAKILAMRGASIRTGASGSCPPRCAGTSPGTPRPRGP
jgi:hypothetical protein